MFGFAVNVDPSQRSAEMAAECGVSGMGCSRESNHGAVMRKK